MEFWTNGRFQFTLIRRPLKIRNFVGKSVCGTSGQVFGDGARMSGKDELGSNFAERRQNEETLMRPRMRKDKPGRVFNEAVEGNEINVQRPGFVGLFFGTAAKSSLNGLALGEECLRTGFLGKDYLKGGVGKRGRVRRAIHWRSDPRRGEYQRRNGQRLQTSGCFSQIF